MTLSTTLLHSPADVIGQLIIDLGLGVTFTNPPTDWQVNVSNEPHTPDNVITTYDTSATNDGRSQIDGEKYQHYGVQVRIRSSDHTTGYVKSQAIAVAFDETVYQNTVTIDGSNYLVHSISRDSEVLAIGKETPESRRRVFTINALTCIRLIES